MGMDALWNDDFHHSAMVALTGQQRGLLHRLLRQPAGVHLGGEVRLPLPGPALPLAEAARAARPRWTSPRRSSSPSSRITIRSPTPAAASAATLDQRPALSRRMTALLLLGPGTPMLFQGQEFAAAPVPLFRRSQRQSPKLIRKGRAKEMSPVPGRCPAGDAGVVARPGRPRHVYKL